MNHGSWLPIVRPGFLGIAGCMLIACDASSGTPAQGSGALAAAADDAGTVCAANPGSEDREPPMLVSHTVGLWPPNHKFHDIAVEQCVSAIDACDGEVRGQFIWASSDEPIDSIGDGHHAPDIGIAAGATHACVRSERQGPKDGRVYKLGVRVTDSAGNSAEGECLVIVDHDQRGVVGKDSSEAYRVWFDPTQPSESCAGGDDTESTAGAGGSTGLAGRGDEGTAGNGDEGTAGNGDEGTAGNGDEGTAGSGDEGTAGNGGEPIPEGPE